MKPSTKLILLLVVVTLLFIAALVMGVYMNDKDKGRSPNDAIKRNWLKALGGLSAVFAPKIDLKSLSCTEYAQPSGQPGQPVVHLRDQSVKGSFELTDAHPTCSIDIPKDGKHDYRHAELRVAGNAPTVYVHAKFAGKDFPREKRDRSKCSLDPPDPRDPDTLLDGFRLEVSFTEGDVKDPWKCWLKQEANEPISVTVLQDGGRLTLTCLGCKSSPQRIVRMEME